MSEHHTRAFSDIAAEYDRQAAKGRGSDYDDRRDRIEWFACLRVVAGLAGQPPKIHPWRTLWVKIGCIAIKVIESIDRFPTGEVGHGLSHCPGPGWEWDAFAMQWHQPGAKGRAIAVPFKPLRDPRRCWRCGLRLHPTHACAPCSEPGCGRDEGHDGDHLPSAPTLTETCPRCHLVDCSPECIAAEQAESDAYTGPEPRKFA